MRASKIIIRVKFHGTLDAPKMSLENFRSRFGISPSLLLQIVTTSIVVASVFVYKASEEFRKATVMTTIHSTTTPLSEVFFPAITVCNINQVGRQARQSNKDSSSEL